ncbi:hypothetical protein ACFQH6_08515 [Halobacteriaceae archaeon GCM10025711]
MSVTSEGESVVVTVGNETHELPRSAAVQLHDAVGDALTEREEFLRTAGEHREDGSYVVSRRSAESTGNSSVFDSFDELRRLFDRLPEEFTADHLTRAGITGSRRHMLVWHFAENPAFDCTVGSRNPLTGEKTGDQVS